MKHCRLRRLVVVSACVGVIAWLLRRGDVQRMSAGTGVVHSEWNASLTAPVHFVQIWLLPDRRGRDAEFLGCRAESSGSHDRFEGPKRVQMR